MARLRPRPRPDHDRRRLGDIEVGRFMTDRHHPVHFQVPARPVAPGAGRGLPQPRDGDRGWNSTRSTSSPPRETAEVTIRFTDHPGCPSCSHNLEHEDMATMAIFTVT